MGIEITVENYITEELLNGKSVGSTGPDESLIDKGILDSLALVRLITFIEEQYQIVIRDDEVIPDNFQSVNAISAFIRNKT